MTSDLPCEAQNWFAAWRAFDAEAHVRQTLEREETTKVFFPEGAIGEEITHPEISNGMSANPGPRAPFIMAQAYARSLRSRQRQLTEHTALRQLAPARCCERCSRLAQWRLVRLCGVRANWECAPNGAGLWGLRLSRGCSLSRREDISEVSDKLYRASVDDLRNDRAPAWSAHA